MSADHKYPEEVRQEAIRRSIERGHNFHEIERAKRARTIGLHFAVVNGDPLYTTFHDRLIHAEKQQARTGGRIVGLDEYIMEVQR